MKLGGGQLIIAACPPCKTITDNSSVYIWNQIILSQLQVP